MFCSSGSGWAFGEGGVLSIFARTCSLLVAEQMAEWSLQGAGAWKAGGGCWRVRLEHGNILFF